MALTQSTKHLCAMVLLLFACLVCSQKENAGVEGRDALTRTESNQEKQASASNATTEALSPNLNSKGNGSGNSKISGQKLDVKSVLNTRTLSGDLLNATSQMEMQKDSVDEGALRNCSSPNSTSGPGRICNESVRVNRGRPAPGVIDNEMAMNHTRKLNKTSLDSSVAKPQLQSQVTNVMGEALLNASLSEMPDKDSAWASKQTTVNSRLENDKRANFTKQTQELPSQGEKFNMRNFPFSAKRNEEQQQLYGAERHKNHSAQLYNHGESPLIENQTHEGSNSSEPKVAIELYTPALNNTGVRVEGYTGDSITLPMQIKPTELIPAVPDAVNNGSNNPGAQTPLPTSSKLNTPGTPRSEIPTTESTGQQPEGSNSDLLAASDGGSSQNPKHKAHSSSHPQKETVEHLSEAETSDARQSNDEAEQRSLFNVFKPHEGDMNPTHAQNLYSHYGQSSTNSPNKGPGSYSQRAYPPHAIHGLIWEEKQYLLSVLVPIGCGVAGALLIVCVAYAIRTCPGESKRRSLQLPAPLQEVSPPRIDQIMLLADSSDDDSD